MIKLLLSVALFISGAASAKTLELTQGRTIEIRGQVTGMILHKADALLSLATVDGDWDQPIDLIINSPGGYVAPGMQFVAAMRIAQERGYTIRCVVPTLAASMAFIILNECDERYVFDTSYLLWHSIRRGLRGVFTPRDLMKMVRSMTRAAKDIDEKLLNELGISRKLFYYHYHNNSLLEGAYLNRITNGNYLTIIDDVEGYKGKLFSFGSMRGSVQDLIRQTTEVGPIQ